MEWRAAQHWRDPIKAFASAVDLRPWPPDDLPVRCRRRLASRQAVSALGWMMVMS
jgi:hypothetical protein